MKSVKTKSYSVYIHKTPNGMVYVGSTSTKPRVRWNNGNGYARHEKFSALILEYGWNAIEHYVMPEYFDRETAKKYEAALIYLTRNGFSINEKYESCFADAEESAKIIGNLERVGAFAFMGTAANVVQIASFLGGNEINWQTAPSAVVSDTPIKRKDMKKKQKQKSFIVKTINGVRVELVLDTRYLHNNGEYPVCIRLYNKRKYRYVSIGYSMTVEEFSDMNPKDEETMRGVFNNYCEKVRNQMSNGWFDLKSADFSIDNAKGTLAGLISEKGATVKTQSTRQTYERIAKRITKIFNDGLPLAAVNGENIGKLVDQMRKDNLSETTIAIYLSTLKAAINYGIYKGVLNKSQYPFKKAACEADKVEIPRGAKRDGWWLDKSEMQVLWNEFLRTKSRSLGYFLFSYLHGGMNLADMMDLRFGDTWDKEHGFGYIRTKTRAKNGFTVKVPATTWTDALLAELGIVPNKGDRVFAELAYKGDVDYLKTKDVVSNRVNKALKTVSKRCGLSREISMTVARHTFASVAIREKFPFIMMDAAMGHAQTGVHSHYVGAFGIDEMRPCFEKLL